MTRWFRDASDTVGSENFSAVIPMTHAGIFDYVRNVRDESRQAQWGLKADILLLKSRIEKLEKALGGLKAPLSHNWSA